LLDNKEFKQIGSFLKRNFNDIYDGPENSDMELIFGIYRPNIQKATQYCVSTFFIKEIKENSRITRDIWSFCSLKTLIKVNNTFYELEDGLMTFKVNRLYRCPCELSFSNMSDFNYHAKNICKILLIYEPVNVSREFQKEELVKFNYVTI
jgi:hypothetical protein